MHLKNVLSVFLRMKKIFFFGKSSRFQKNFVKVARANFAAQLFPFLATPILTRLYSPDDFGLVVLFFSCLSFLLIFATWRVEWSIPNAKSEQDKDGLVFIGLVFLATTCSILLLLLPLNSQDLLQETRLEGFSPNLFILICALFGAGVAQIITGVNIRNADMSPVSLATVVRAVLTISFSIIFGISKSLIVGLVFANIIGIWMETVVLVQKSEIHLFSTKKMSFKELTTVWNKYRKECSLSVAVAAVNYGFIALLPLSLVAIYSVKEVGYYAIATKIAVAPTRLISQAVSQSFWAESSQLIKQDPSSLKATYKKTLLNLSLLSIFPIIVCVCGPLYMGTIFGHKDWSDAGMIVFAMTPQVVGTLIFGSTNHLTVYSKQQYQLFSDSATIVSCLAWLILASAVNLGFVSTIFGVSLITFLGYILRFHLHLKANREYIDDLNSV